MRSVAFLAAAAVVPQAMAHYVFPTLIHNGEQTERYQFVRQAKNSNSPVEDVLSEGIVCNKGGNDDDVLAKTQTRPVNAGDELGFIVENDMGHPGPLSVYLSKAPSAVNTYKGDGDWFKIYDLTTTEITEAGLQWGSYTGGSGLRNFTFTLPAEVPTGEYLVRAEHIGLHGAGTKGGAQFYIACAQISVTGAASGTPAPTVKLPGAYTGDEPGILLNIYYPAPTSYTPPGPATWPNACEDHTANLLGQTSDGDCTGSTGGGNTTRPPPTRPPTTPPANPTRPAPVPSAGIPDYNGGNTTAPTNPTTPVPSNQPKPDDDDNDYEKENGDDDDDDCKKSAARRRARSLRRRAARAAL